jgi:alkanesulfonate monooxygenase SsuD/methylene tetrahydromethanopterin reductase-like flavin-dependent oxidoreductase (luciferase family)
VCANDHVVFGAPWLDGPTALAAVVAASGDATLFTTVANPVTRGPASLAKVLAGLDVLSGGRLVAGLGPGSSERDYRSVGVPFDERWARFDEALRATRALLAGESFTGRFHSVDGPLEPLPAQPGGPPLWVGSWGSAAGLRRAARWGDGWLASAYNTTPEAFRDGWARVQGLRAEAGHDATDFANGLATCWFHLDDHRAEEVFDERLAPVVRRPREELLGRLAFGSASQVVEKVAAFRDAGVQWLFVWPVTDELEQLHRFSEGVIAPLGR